MKKLIVISAVLLLSSHAMAADWSFSGSIRMATWYDTADWGDSKVNGQTKDEATLWYFQGNSRLEAKARQDNITGHIEINLGNDGTNVTTENGNGNDTPVSTRRAYGTWKFADNAWLKIGKDYSPVSDFISNQFYGEDGNLLGFGQFYGKRPAGLTLGVGGFEIAFLTPTRGADLNTTSTGINNATGGDPDSYIPRVEAAYMLNIGTGYIRPFGGFQWYRVQETGQGNITGDIDVWSWVLGISSNWHIGAFSIGGQISYGMNESNVRSWQFVGNRASSSATLKTGGDDIANSYTLQFEIVPSYTVTDWLRLEAGFGYRMDNPHGAPGYSRPDGVYFTYFQGMITMAPGVFLCPEVGYLNSLDDYRGKEHVHGPYAGAKWQIDF